MNINKQHVQRQFNRSARKYDRVSRMQRDIVDVLLTQLSASMVTELCDIGCGTGYGLSKLAEVYPEARITGLDLALAMLHTARTRMGTKGMNFVQGDIENLPFRRQSMDLCFSSSAIQWCDLERSLTQISTTLKPGGYAVISSFLNGTLQAWRELWGHNDQYFLSMNEFKQAFDKTGLELEEIWSEPYVQSFDSFEAAQSSIRRLGAGNASNNRSKGLMSRDKLTQIVRRVNDLINLHGSIDLNYQVVYARAIKVGHD